MKCLKSIYSRYTEKGNTTYKWVVGNKEFDNARDALHHAHNTNQSMQRVEVK